MNNKKFALIADLSILSLSLFWGTSYLFINIALAEIPPFEINAIRFVFAAVIVFIIFIKKAVPTNVVTIKYALITGACVTSAYTCVTFAIKLSTISTAAFLGATIVIFTPIIVFILFRVKPPKKLAVVVFLALIGIILITLRGTFVPRLGDIVCLLGAVSFSLGTIIAEKAVQKPAVNPLGLAAYQLIFAAVFLTVLMFFFETPVIPKMQSSFFSLVFLAVPCTGYAYVVQNSALKFTSATKAGVIISLQPVFSGLAAFFFAGEVMTTRVYIGAAVLIFSILLMEINFEKTPKRS